MRKGTCLSSAVRILSAASVAAIACVSSAIPSLRGQQLPVASQTVSVTQATILISESASSRELSAVDLLITEEFSRTGIRWQLTRGAAGAGKRNGNTIVVGELAELPHMLAPAFMSLWREQAPDASFQAKREGFTIRTFREHGGTTVVVAGNDGRGVLYGAGCLLRHMEMSSGEALLPDGLSETEAPEVPIRSHQIGYRFKNNTYDAWTLPMFEQQIRELAVFGISGLQVISPNSDDQQSSPLFPAPALDTVVGISRLLDKYGLDCDLYYPEMRKDYRNPITVASELRDFEALVKAMPRINALYVPGGDPGHTAPGPLLALVEKQTAILKRYHSHATVWVSAQGFDQKDFAEFYRLLRDEHPGWLTGVFFGPQSRDRFEKQRARIPAKYRMLFYPDIGHTMYAQFPVPQWDPVFALTEGREPIDPRPVDETHIYQHFARLHTGFVTYSEGVNDDVNKLLWTQLGWSSDTDPRDTLEEYSRYFFGPRLGNEPSSRVAESIFELEQDWRGPIASNGQTQVTFALLNRLNAEASPKQQNNWRFESLLYRADYDAYLQARLKVESAQQGAALRQLVNAPVLGSTAAMDAALKEFEPPATATGIRARIEALAAQLFEHVGLQLSVTKYGASGIERGANLDRIDIPLNDRVWMERRFADIRRMPGEKQRLAAIDEIVNWTHRADGAIYDDLGNPGAEPHLVRGKGFIADPEMYETAIDGVADHTTEDGWRMSQLTYAETLYEYPLEVHYKGLDNHTHYKVRLVYAGEEYTLPLELIANDSVVIHGLRLRKCNPETVEFELPTEATSGGTLDLKWNRPRGIGGGGRGRQVAEIWLLPQR